MAEITCVHHWIFPSPDGPQSEGVCKKCGATRIGQNSIESTWKQRVFNQRQRAFNQSELAPRRAAP